MQGALTLPGFGVATFALGDFFTYLQKSSNRSASFVLLFCWYSKNHLVSTNFRQNMFFFPIIFQKRDLENPPKKMNPKFYQDTLSYRYTSYDHLFMHVMSSNESKHPTRINYNHITKTNLGCRLGIGRKLVFLLGKHIFLFEKQDTSRFKPIELMYMIRGGIFCSWF